MRKWIAAFFILAFAASAGAGDFKGICTMRFKGTSTLHDFSGTARCEPFTVHLSKTGDGRTIAPSVEIETLVAGMDTKNDDRDRQMRNMFQSEKYPRIKAALTDLDPEKIRSEIDKDPNKKSSVELALKIRDVERKIRAVIGNLKENSGHVSFSAEFPVSLKEYGLKPPKVLFGAISVGDRVTVNLDFTLDAVHGN